MTVAEVRKRTAEVMGDNGERFTCTRCDGPATRNEMSTFGARCHACYEAYKREPQPPQKLWTGRRPGQQGLFGATTEGDQP